ncbi:MAG: F0F1 ATP synthase subunit B [Deltaproteobacteria bacterium]|nr:F0F1 ATP synthase subunit B [Deltaproteobacteria bacterium]
MKAHFTPSIGALTVMAIILAPTIALASEAGEASALASALWHLANLVIFLALLIWLAGPRLRAYLFQRRKEIEGQLNEARRLRAEAEARDAEWRGKLDGLQADAARITTEARELGRLEREKILAQAREQAERIQQDAERTASHEMARARTELREEAVRLAMKLAARMVRENVNEEDQKRLVEEYLRSVGRTT